MLDLNSWIKHQTTNNLIKTIKWRVEGINQ